MLQPDLLSIFIDPLEKNGFDYYREGGSEKHISDISKMLVSDLVNINYDILNEFIRVYDLQNQMEKVKSFRNMV
jgi:hypothetical protein